MDNNIFTVQNCNDCKIIHMEHFEHSNLNGGGSGGDGFETSMNGNGGGRLGLGWVEFRKQWNLFK